MKTVATILAISAVLAAVSASGYGGGASAGGYGGGASAGGAGGYGGGASAGGAGGYGAASIPAPPCPKNYLFSCQPNLAPAPCSQAAGGYGSAGAYSENIPTILNAPYGYNVPQNLQHQVPNFYGQNVGSF